MRTITYLIRHANIIFSGQKAIRANISEGIEPGYSQAVQATLLLTKSLNKPNSPSFKTECTKAVPRKHATFLEITMTFQVDDV